MKRKAAFVRTLKQARAYILRVGICGIFSDAGVGMPNLWDSVDLPDRRPEKRGGDKRSWRSGDGRMNYQLLIRKRFSDQYLDVVQLHLVGLRRGLAS